MEPPFMGLIGMFGLNFAPRGWAQCDGQILSIASNSALFSLLGTSYGGDGRTTFALPDMRGRMPLHAGRGDGLTDRMQGQRFGFEQETLNILNLPPHTHEATATSRLDAENADAAGANPNGTMLATTADNLKIYAAPDDPQNRPMSSESISTRVQVGMTGQGQPLDIRQPCLAVNFCIALNGIYPSRQ